MTRSWLPPTRAAADAAATRALMKCIAFHNLCVCPRREPGVRASAARSLILASYVKIGAYPKVRRLSQVRPFSPSIHDGSAYKSTANSPIRRSQRAWGSILLWFSFITAPRLCAGLTRNASTLCSWNCKNNVGPESVRELRRQGDTHCYALLPLRLNSRSSPQRFLS